ncbi:MAG TPA: single-stranded-DNA-specific exonuclease RecJ [Sporosarcina sp.]|nr:single-stranded-DNA-specific exonuclease RecJ [Sporosarcina sp.]
MIQSKKQWSIQRPDEEIVNELMKSLNLSSIQAKILVSRGFTSVEETSAFLELDASILHDPFLMNDMQEAVDQIKAAIQAEEMIAVYGDYDADGVTSVTVLMTALERLGAEAFFVIPNRFEHGYGPNKALFEEISAMGASMIITVDNGIAGVEQIAYAKSLGLKVIVTDHHEAGETLPEADAILHPRIPEGHYSFADLAGVGVAFKLATALLGKAPLDLLEVVAIGTVADLVPLKDENRYFVQEGLRQLKKTTRPGLKALLSVAGTKEHEITEDTIGFMIGPRLNAPGRLGDADLAVELLMTETLDSAMTIAEQLNTYNKERQEIVKAITAEAEQMIVDEYGTTIPHVFVLAKEGWNPGVVGIVASRITEKYYRPTVILSKDPETGMAKGSARSIEGFHLYNELAKNKALLTHFGGHPVAAGLAMPIEQVDELRKNLIEQAKDALTDEQLIPKVFIDVPLSIHEIDVTALESLDRLRPFGMNFEKPMYLIEHVRANQVRRIGADQRHLKLEVTDGSQSLDVIGFSQGTLAEQLSPGIDFSIIGDLQINEWNGIKKPQLLLDDLFTDAWQLFDLRGIREPSRWMNTIPMNEAHFIAFKEETKRQFEKMPALQQPIELASDQTIEKDQSIVLLDLPTTIDEIEGLIRTYKPNRIYAHFYTPESSYFNTMPTREQFGWYYSFLKSRGTFNLQMNGQKLAAHKGWKIDLVYFMTNVFSDLEFVKIENGVIHVLEVERKRQLTEAPSYKRREEQMALEQTLLYAPYYELKEWFERIR